MEVRETKRSSGYSKPPWIFKGSALYQLHLVKAETARAFIPKEFKLVEAFGYTLGGFFLANYDDSPAGVFDELVVIAGLVWNPPTSCAWAARVLVNSNEACNHGRKDVGLPSQVARFSKAVTAIPRQRGKVASFLNMIGMSASFHNPKECMDLQVTEINGHGATDICNINLKTTANKWMGPAIKMSLPSFSGCTEYNQNLLKYSCQIECRVLAVQPAKILGPSRWKTDEDQSLEDQGFSTVGSTNAELIDNGRNLSISVMLSKPILALQFNCLKMQVKAPVIVSQSSESSLRTS